MDSLLSDPSGPWIRTISSFGVSGGKVTAPVPTQGLLTSRPNICLYSLQPHEAAVHVEAPSNMRGPPQTLNSCMFHSFCSVFCSSHGIIHFMFLACLWFKKLIPVSLLMLYVWNIGRRVTWAILTPSWWRFQKSLLLTFLTVIFGQERIFSYHWHASIYHWPNPLLPLFLESYRECKTSAQGSTFLGSSWCYQSLSTILLGRCDSKLQLTYIYINMYTDIYIYLQEKSMSK